MCAQQKSRIQRSSSSKAQQVQVPVPTPTQVQIQIQPVITTTMQSTKSGNNRPQQPSQQSKSKLISQLRPFRKVAKSAKINLNRYWGILSQRNSNASSNHQDLPAAPELVEYDYAQEMEQNRVNELLEAQAEAYSQNSYNSAVEEELRSRRSTASSTSTTSTSSTYQCRCCYFDSELEPAASPAPSRPISPTNPSSIFYQYYYDRDNRQILLATTTTTASPNPRRQQYSSMIL